MDHVVATLRALGRMGMVTEADRSVVTPLLPFRLPLTVTEALETLRATIEPYQLLALYKHYFPVEYEKSKARKFVRAKEVYSPAEYEFFALVNECIFPLAYWFVDMTEEDFGEQEEGRDPIIPVWPIGFDPEEGYFGELTVGERFVLALSGMDRPEKGEDYGFEPELVDGHVGDAFSRRQHHQRDDTPLRGATRAAEVATRRHQVCVEGDQQPLAGCLSKTRRSAPPSSRNGPVRASIGWWSITTRPWK
jgi:hypothetical protein